MLNEKDANVRVLTVAGAAFLISAVAATLCDEFGPVELYRLLKPVPIICALIIAFVARSQIRGGKVWLLCALMASMAGDILLLSQGLFIPGLIAFLVAHVFYIIRFMCDAPFLPKRISLAIICALGLANYLFIAQKLPPALLLPVGIYAGAITLMAAQAIARAQVLKTPASLMVAVGAMTFVISDTILSINRFVAPFQGAQILNSLTYYGAQYLLVFGLTAPSVRRR